MTDSTRPEVDILKQAVKKLKEVAEIESSRRAQNSKNSVNMMGANTPAQLKSYSIRMIKALKEDLAKIQNEYIARVNANIDDYLANRDCVKVMNEDTLRDQINYLS